MKRPGVFTGIRALVRIGHSLERIAAALEALARVHAPTGLTAEPPEEPLTLAGPADHDFDEIDRVARRLAATLGRDPEPEELLHELDHTAYSDEETAAARRARTPPALRQD